MPRPSRTSSSAGPSSGATRTTCRNRSAMGRTVPGATISAGLFRNFDREAAARYSFLLSVPAVVLSGLFELGEIGGEDGASPGATVIATLAAFVSGYAAIAWLLRYLANHTLDIFVAYRLPLGILVIALAATGTIS